ncbi:MAG: methyltransferase [Rickettsiales bacterium]|jgi:tRNA1(Val) A37 N6-methylase TrmN6|nr:methyltransferase [Rickettsiales bacterium]
MKQKQDIFTALSGRVKFRRGAYNVTSDAVFLAAFAASGARGNILDVGVGTGGVALCMLEHNPDLQITGLDVSPEMLAAARENSALNGREIELISGDILTWKTARTFDVVVTNPPYFRGSARAGGAHHNADIYAWTRACLRRVRPHGKFYCIIDIGQTDTVIAALHESKCGGITMCPLVSSNGPERVLLSAKQGAKSPFRLLPPVDMNDDGVLRDKFIIHNS